MNINNFSILEALTDKMRWLQGNQQVVSENISHSDTPGYTPQRLAEQDFSALVEKISRLRVAGDSRNSVRAPTAPTSPNHGDSSTFNRIDATVHERRPDGNGVALEEETMLLASNQMDFALVTALYRKNHKLMRLALGKNA